LRQLLRYFKPYWWVIVFIMIMKFAGAILELMIPSSLADILDVGVPSGSVRMIVNFGLKMIFFALTEAIVNIIGNIAGSKLAHTVIRKLRQDLFVRISHLSARQMDQVTIPAAVNHLTSDTYNLGTMFLRCLRMGLRAPVLMFGSIFIAAGEDLVLAMVLLATMPLVIFVAVVVAKRAIPLFRQSHEAQDRMIRKVQESAVGIRVIKALSKTDYEKQRFAESNEDCADIRLKAGLEIIKTHPVSQFIVNVGMVMVVLVSAWRVNLGVMTPGKIIAFLNYLTIISASLLSITGIFIACTDGAASAQRILRILNMPEDLTSLPEEKPQEEENPYAVEFRNVCFSYNDVEDNLRNISFALKKGQTLGIIGATGSGKTTLINLLLRFYDVNRGEILLNGRDIRTIPNEELRKMFGVTFQNDFLVADTVRRNIDFYRELDDEAINKAAVMAQAASFIEEKEGGLDHQLTIKGNNLSGGQKQRLLIARALAGSPEILILDDASSALDYRTDASLRKALAENYQGTTKIIIAQRVSSIQSADCILVLENGRILGKGTHEELLASCEEYQHIAKTQMEIGAGEEVTVNV